MKLKGTDPLAPQEQFNGLSLSEFNILATYNAEVSRGIVHTAEYDIKMAFLQSRYDQGGMTDES